MAELLYSDDCSSVGEANELFATERGLLVLRPRRRDCCCSSLWFTVPSGCYALVSNRKGGGKQLLDYIYEDGNRSAVWPEGVHCPFPPWIGVSHLVTKQSVVLDVQVMGCKTRDDVSASVNTSIVFRIMGDETRGEDPELVRNFVYDIKPQGLEQELRNVLEEAVHTLARKMNHSEIYEIWNSKKEADADHENDKDENGDEEMENFGRISAIVETSNETKKTVTQQIISGERAADEVRNKLNSHFMPKGVEIQSAIIKSVKLPDHVISQMTADTLMIIKRAEQRLNRQNEIQNTHLDQEVQTMMQAFRGEQELEKIAGAEAINAERVKLNDAKALAIKAERIIDEETKVKREKIRAENAAAVQRIRDDMDAAVAKIHSDARTICVELVAGTKLETETLLSESKLKATINYAEADRILAQAEGKIAKWLEKKREYETKERQLQVYERLAENDDLILSGSSDEDVNVIAVADAIRQRASEGLDPSRHSIILAELALLNKGLINVLEQGVT